MGVTLQPADMFRYARGEVVTITSGLKFKMDRALDWFAITDHAGYMGLADQLRAGNATLLASPKKWFDPSRAGPKGAYQAATEAIQSIFINHDEVKQPELSALAWTQALDAAEQFNEAGVFTTLQRFEWTSAPEGNNLHRTVIFRDSVNRVRQIVPFSAFDSLDPADLWKYMDRYEKLTSGQWLAILTTAT